MVAVIVGATGLVGSELVVQLLESPKVTKVISLARRRLGIENTKLNEIVVRDLEEMSQHRSALKGDLYFCCLGTTIKTAGSKENFKKIDFEAIFDFGKIAKSHSAKAFSLVSASSANPRSPIFYSRTKGETELSLRELDFPRLVIWRPGLLMGDRHEFRLGEKVMVTLFEKLGPRLPQKASRKIITYVDHLAKRMTELGTETMPGTFVFEASQI